MSSFMWGVASAILIGLTFEVTQRISIAREEVPAYSTPEQPVMYWQSYWRCWADIFALSAVNGVVIANIVLVKDWMLLIALIGGSCVAGSFIINVYVRRRRLCLKTRRYWTITAEGKLTIAGWAHKAYMFIQAWLIGLGILLLGQVVEVETAVLLVGGTLYVISAIADDGLVPFLNVLSL